MKAILADRGVEFPKTHLWEKLVDLLPKDIARTSEVLQSARLSVYAAAARYPGEEETES